MSPATFPASEEVGEKSSALSGPCTIPREPNDNGTADGKDLIQPSTKLNLETFKEPEVLPKIIEIEIAAKQGKWDL